VNNIRHVRRIYGLYNQSFRYKPVEVREGQKKLTTVMHVMRDRVTKQLATTQVK
jgi:hypothetical protein